MPTSFDDSTTGFCIWVNLSAANKTIKPRHQYFKNDHIPVVKKDGLKVKVLSGEWGKVKGPIVTESPVWLFDVEIDNPNSKINFDIDIPRDWNRMMFVYEGQATYKDESNKHTI